MKDHDTAKRPTMNDQSLDAPPSEANPKSGGASRRRGFAAIDPAKQREIAAAGGRAAHAQGRAHEFTSEEARRAGRKGGQKVARDPAHMARIGKLGGEARARNDAALRREKDIPR